MTAFEGPTTLVWECEECWLEQDGINHRHVELDEVDWRKPLRGVTCYCCGRDAMLRAIPVHRYVDLAALPATALA